MANLARKMDAPTLLDDGERLDYPTVYLSAEQVTALGLWQFDVGDDTKMQATIRVASKSQDAGDDRHVTVELIDATVKPKEGVDANRMFPSTVAAAPPRVVR